MSSSESSEDFFVPERPDRDEIERMIKQGLVTWETKCKFKYLHKGIWTYTFKANGETCRVSGGEATHERAYGLELKASYPLSKMIHMMGD